MDSLTVTEPTLPDDEGGETACWAHLVCPECGMLTADGDHPLCQPEVWIVCDVAERASCFTRSRGGANAQSGPSTRRMASASRNTTTQPSAWTDLRDMGCDIARGLPIPGRVDAGRTARMRFSSRTERKVHAACAIRLSRRILMVRASACGGTGSRCREWRRVWLSARLQSGRAPLWSSPCRPGDRLRDRSTSPARRIPISGPLRHLASRCRRRRCRRRHRHRRSRAKPRSPPSRPRP